MYFYYEIGMKGQLMPRRSIFASNIRVGECLITVPVHGQVHQVEGEDETMSLNELQKKYPPKE